MNGISTGIFDIFKIGPGPSSSHTIAPMRAGNDFRNRATHFPEATRLEVELLGSLALTGVGHGTDRAVAAGLLGEFPENCDTERLNQLLTDPQTVYMAHFGENTVRFSKSAIRFNRAPHTYPYSNTMIFRLRNEAGDLLTVEVYYSVGGGFLLRDGEEPVSSTTVPYRYRNWESFRLLQEKYSLSPAEILLRNETAVSGRNAAAIRQRLAGIIDSMCRAVTRGLAADGLLPGPLGLERRAKQVHARALAAPDMAARSLLLLDAFALAAAEENAAGHLVVTAPTSGSAGVLPGVIYFLLQERNVSPEHVIDGLLMAALIAMLAKHNASISGAEVGCQGEIGVAAAMAAGLLAAVNGGSFDEIGAAAEIALEHHLGLSCDPVDGYVQIPCIERNAVGAVSAYNAALLASASVAGRSKVTLDEVIDALNETGKGMSPAYKETSCGGLAVCTLCR